MLPRPVDQPARRLFQVRQKYDDKLPKWFAQALRDLGFEEDRGACTEIACAGKYKQQHDTDKDLKFLHVYPKAELKQGGGAAAEEGASSLASLGSPSYLATACAFDTFKKMVLSKTQSWSQRKRMLAELKLSGQRFVAIEARMMSAQPLSDEEQDLYDVTSREALEEKVVWLEACIKDMADAGQLTAGEKQQVLSTMAGRLDTLAGDLAEARAEGKAKKVGKLEQQAAQIEARRSAISQVEPVRHPLKHEERIKELRVAIIPLVELEGLPGLRSMDEMKKIGNRPDLEAEASRLEEESRGWFEEDEEFQARCAIIAAAAAVKAARKNKDAKAKASAASKAKASDGWETMGSQGGSTGRRR